MQSFNDFIKSRQYLNLNFKVRNFVSFLLFGYLSVTILRVLNPQTKEMATFSIMGLISLTLILSIIAVKIRYVQMLRKNNKSLHEYLVAAIREARLNGNYEITNQLLDSKYSVHMILAMSRYPEESFDYTQLSKWVKLKDAMAHFRKNNIKEEDLLNPEIMTDYLKQVYPEFLQALSKEVR